VKDDIVEITVRMYVNVGDAELAVYDSQYMGEGKPSLLKYIRWLAENEGLLGVVEDDFKIISAKLVK
jgi:hypothetical protein